MKEISFLLKVAVNIGRRIFLFIFSMIHLFTVNYFTKYAIRVYSFTKLLQKMSY